MFHVTSPWRNTLVHRWRLPDESMSRQNYYSDVLQIRLTVLYLQLEEFTAEKLASLMRCDLPGNSSQSRVLWKLLLTKLSSVLNPALDMLANMVSSCCNTVHKIIQTYFFASFYKTGLSFLQSEGMIPSAEAILDVIEEIRLSALTDQELMNSSVIQLWFTERLSNFLPSVSRRFLICLTSRNFSCPSYQQMWVKTGSAHPVSLFYLSVLIVLNVWSLFLTETKEWKVWE